MYKRLIVGSLVGCLSLSAQAADTGLWTRSADRMHFAFADNVFHDQKAYRFKCQFIGDSETTMTRVCSTEKSGLTGDAQLITRDTDGQLQALSTVINIQNTESNQIATVIDGTMLSYLLGKVDENEMLRRAKAARVKLLGDVERRNRVVYDRGDATITAYLRGPELHIDVDRPPQLPSEE